MGIESRDAPMRTLTNKHLKPIRPHLAKRLSVPNLSLREIIQAQNGVPEIGSCLGVKMEFLNWGLEAPKPYKTGVIETLL